MNEEDFDKVIDRFLPYRESREKGAEYRKTYGDVFDRRTLLAFYKLLKRSIEYVEFPISTGKEAIVFRARGKHDELLAVKVYLISRSNYKGLSRFIDGDDRFEHVHKTRDNIVFIWARKEYRNLKTYHANNVRVPEPVDMWKNIVVMQYIGDEEKPAPLMKDVMESLKRDFVFELIEEMKNMLRAGLVHGDLSEYNILVYEGKPWIIDVAQAVPKSHYLAPELLARDIKNIIKIGDKLGANLSKKELMKELEVI